MQKNKKEVINNNNEDWSLAISKEEFDKRARGLRTVSDVSSFFYDIGYSIGYNIGVFMMYIFAFWLIFSSAKSIFKRSKAVEEVASSKNEKLIFWKVYFWYALISALMGYPLAGLERVFEIVDVVVFGLGLLGLYGFCWDKNIFSKLFWKVFLCVFVVWNVAYHLIIPDSEFIAQIYGSSSLVVGLLALMSTIPFLFAMYIYGFKNNDY